MVAIKISQMFPKEQNNNTNTKNKKDVKERETILKKTYSYFKRKQFRNS